MICLVGSITAFGRRVYSKDPERSNWCVDNEKIILIRNAMRAGSVYRERLGRFPYAVNGG
jgi:hypothetical protein